MTGDNNVQLASASIYELTTYFHAKADVVRPDLEHLHAANELG